jgi:ectoine hydroxylase-related dioxygenase (phytanoyl-CoA dioxygenase family)
VADGEIYASHLATWVALADVLPETGFCLVPGSHKSHLPDPEKLTVWSDPPTSITMPMEAGDVIVFSTRLLHNAAPWTQDYPRLNIFQRYVFSWFFDMPHLYPLEAYRDWLCEEMYELESMRRQEKRVVRRVREMMI